MEERILQRVPVQEKYVVVAILTPTHIGMTVSINCYYCV